MEWENPEGRVVESYSFGATENRFYPQVKFASTGTYTLVVRGYRSGTGSVTLTAYNASDVKGTIAPSAEGETKTVTISVPGQFARYTFSGTEGQTITLEAKESTIANGFMSLWNPAGSRVSEREAFSSGFGAHIEATLSTSGTYTILLEPIEGDTGSIELAAYLGSHADLVRGRASGKDASLAQTSFLSAGIAQPLMASPATGEGRLRRTSFREPAPRAGGAGLARVSRRRHTAYGSEHGRPSEPRERRGRRLAVAASGISVEMRRFRPRSPADWQPGRDGGRVQPGEGEAVSPWTRAARLQGFPGATALSGQVLAQDGLPVAGVRVAIEGTYLAARTDEAGRFLLSGRVPSGRRVLVIEGERTPGTTRYGTYSVGVDIVAHETNMLPYTVWLTPLDRAGDLRVGSSLKHEVRLRTSQVPGLEVRIPAGSVITDRAGRVVRELNLTAIPVARPPFPLPAFTEVPLYFTVQPGGAWLSKGAQIIYPNWGHLRPGQRVPFWNYEPKGRGWYVYGEGTVTANGKQVVPDPGVRVWEFSGAMITDSPRPPGKGPKPGAHGWGADPVDLGTGLFAYHKTDLVIPDTIPIVIQQTYRQADSNSYSFGIGDTSLYDIRLWSENNYQEADLILPDGGRVHYVRTSPGYGYAEAEYKSVSTPGEYYDSTLKWNGDGWNLTLTDGMTYVFGENAPLQAIRDRYGNQTHDHALGWYGGQHHADHLAARLLGEALLQWLKRCHGNQ